jgi:hypothetical protein
MDPQTQGQYAGVGGQPYPPAPVSPQSSYPQVQPAGLPRPENIYPDTNPAAMPSVQPLMPQNPQAPAPQYPAQPTPMPVATPTGPPIKVHPKPSNPNSTQNALQIAEIRDGIVIMNDGSFRTVVMVKSINFDLMSQQEQEAVEYAYQGFLNSLYFPIQIFIRSQKIDLQPYIDRLDRIRTQHDNMLLALLMDDYVGFIDQLAEQTNLMDKKFYVVIPYFPVIDPQKALTQSKNFFSGIVQLFGNTEDHVVINEPDLQKAKDELRNRVQAVLGALLQCGIQGLPLDTQELIELFYDTYNPDTATRQQLKNFGDLTADIVTKGQGMASQPHLRRELQ